MDGRDLTRMLALELVDVIDEELTLLAADDTSNLKEGCRFPMASGRPTTAAYGVSLVQTCDGNLRAAHPRHLCANFNNGKRFTRDLRARWPGVRFDQVVLVRRVLLNSSEALLWRAL